MFTISGQKIGSKITSHKAEVPINCHRLLYQILLKAAAFFGVSDVSCVPGILVVFSTKNRFAFCILCSLINTYLVIFTGAKITETEKYCHKKTSAKIRVSINDNHYGSQRGSAQQQQVAIFIFDKHFSMAKKCKKREASKHEKGRWKQI